jgi:hypothetical protein
MIDLDFYLQSDGNRSHYNNSPFLSDPNQYLYHHIAFDEFVYELLRKNPEGFQQTFTEDKADVSVEGFSPLPGAFAKSDDDLDSVKS